jgi:hypothetical protein
MTNVYILGLEYTNSTLSGLSPNAKTLQETLGTLKGPSQLEIRVGYFGTCVRERGIVWLCSSDTNGIAQQIGPDKDPLNLIGAASNFKDDVLFSGLLIMAIILAFLTVLLLSTFPGWQQETDTATGSVIDVKPFPSQAVSRVVASFSLVAAILGLIGSLWQHVGTVGAAAMAEMANYGNVQTTVGAGAVAMAWIAVVLLSVVFLAMLVMILSIKLLDRLSD